MRKLIYLGLLLFMPFMGQSQDLVVFYQSTAGINQTDTLYLYFQALGSQDREVSSITLSVNYTSGASLLANQVQSKFASQWGTTFELCTENSELASYNGVSFTKRAKYAITTASIQGITIPSITSSSGVMMMKIPFQVSGTSYGLYHVEGSLENPVNEIGDAQGAALSFITWDATNPFPVELLSFEGEAQDDGSVLLRWATATEMNNAYFELEKSVDGEYFSPLGRVAGERYSQQIRSYQYRDESFMYNTNYYRLKQVDLNGSVHYTNVVVVNFGVLSSKKFSMYPNPTTGKLFVETQLAPDGPLKAEVYDLWGRKLLSQNWEAGKNQIEIDAEGWLSGVYVLKIKDEFGKVEINRIVKK